MSKVKVAGGVITLQLNGSRWLFVMHWIVSCPACGYVGPRKTWQGAMKLANSHARTHVLRMRLGTYTLAGPE